MRLAVFASGTGSIMEAMLGRGLRVDVLLVDRACRAETLAADAEIPTLRVERDSYGADFDRHGYTERIMDALDGHDVDVVALAGFGTILGPEFFARYERRVLNTHPALLPSFPGWHAVRDALAAGVKVTGCTVHVATAVVDDGPILAQIAVPVLPDDDESRLHERIKAVERDLYPATIAAFLRDLEHEEVSP